MPLVLGMAVFSIIFGAMVGQSGVAAANTCPGDDKNCNTGSISIVYNSDANNTIKTGNNTAGVNGSISIGDNGGSNNTVTTGNNSIS